MDRQPQKVKPRKHQGPVRVAIYVAAGISLPLLLRNLIRLHSHLDSYHRLLELINAPLSKLPAKQSPPLPVFLTVQAPLLLPALLPSIAQHFYHRRYCKFYHQVRLNCTVPVTYRFKGVPHSISLRLKTPHVGEELVEFGRELEKAGRKGHGQQTVAVEGVLLREGKGWALDVGTMGLDHVELVKYWQSRLLAVVFSGFYWGTVLGGAIGVGLMEGVGTPWLNKKVEEGQQTIAASQPDQIDAQSIS